MKNKKVPWKLYVFLGTIMIIVVSVSHVYNTRNYLKNYAQEKGSIINNIYKNDKYHFTLEFPKEWPTAQQLKDGLLYGAKNNDSEVVVAAERIIFGVGKRKGYFWGVDSIKDISTLEKISQRALAGVTTDEWDATILDTYETKVNGEDAFVVELETTFRNLEYPSKRRITAYFFAKGYTRYAIEASYASVNHEQMKEVITQTVNSLKITQSIAIWGLEF